MADNPLVAPEGDPGNNGLVALLGPVDNGVNVAKAIGDGDFIEAGLQGMAGGLGVLGVISDPLGSLFSWGVGWLIDNVEPFPTWLDELCGDPEQISSFAQTWHNVAGRVGDNADQLRDAVTSSTSHWEGVAVDAYRGAGDGLAGVIDGFSGIVSGVAYSVEAAGGLVGGVRSTVKDTIAEIVGSIGSALFKFLSVVLAPDAVRTLTTKVATLSAKIGKFVDDLIVSMGKFGGMLDDLLNMLKQAGDKIQDLEKIWKALPGKSEDIALNTANSLATTDDY